MEKSEASLNSNKTGDVGLYHRVYGLQLCLKKIGSKILVPTFLFFILVKIKFHSDSRGSTWAMKQDNQSHWKKRQIWLWFGQWHIRRSSRINEKIKIKIKQQRPQITKTGICTYAHTHALGNLHCYFWHLELVSMCVDYKQKLVPFVSAAWSLYFQCVS
jgi:hypothetical protein